MTAVPVLNKLAAGVSALFGLTSLGGGIIGYVKAGSLVSLIAGGIAGLLLLGFAFLIPRKPTIGLIGAAIVALALFGRFIKGAIEPSTDPEKEFANLFALIMTGGGVLVVVFVGLALAFRSRRAGP